jgi:hypothetical protein
MGLLFLPEVGHEPFAPSPPANLAVGQAFRPEPLVELVKGSRPGHRTEEVPLGPLDQVLDAALLVAGPGVGEHGLEPVVGGQGLELRRLGPETASEDLADDGAVVVELMCLFALCAGGPWHVTADTGRRPISPVGGHITVRATRASS